MLEPTQHQLNIIQALRETVQEYCQMPILESYRFDSELHNHYFGAEADMHIVMQLLGGYESESFEDGKVSHDIYEVMGLKDELGNDFSFRFEEEDENISGLSRRVSIYGDCDETDAANIEAIFWEVFANYH
jgi:hypothetical protein